MNKIICMALFAGLGAANAFAGNQICARIDLSDAKNFVSQQWQSSDDGGCGESGVLEVIIPIDVTYKLYQHDGGKCTATEQGNLLRINFKMDFDSGENCQLFMIKRNGTKATLSINAPVGS